MLGLVQLLNYVWCFATPWTAAHQASMSFTISQSLLKLMSTVSVMPSKHLTFCFPLLLLLVLGLGQHKIYVVHKCNMFIFHWFYFPVEYINTFHRSLSAILLIFILNPCVVSSCLKNAHLCLCILPWEEILQHLLSNRASLTYLGEMIFPIDFFDVYYSCVFFSYMFLCLHFFLSNCMELCDITEPQESFY